ncbi:hypothetical protein BDR22DRAFT_832189 [Usnea florida]
MRYGSQKSRTETPNRGSGSLECSANNKRSFQEIIGFKPELSWGANYISEYCNIQEQLGSDLGDGIEPGRLNSAGTVFDSSAYFVDSKPSQATYQIKDASAGLEALRHPSPAACTKAFQVILQWLLTFISNLQLCQMRLDLPSTFPVGFSSQTQVLFDFSA